MKIIRWLLSHTFLILLIVAVIYGYMFWGNLAGEDTPAGKAIGYLSNEFEGVSEFVAATKTKQESLNQQSSAKIELSEAQSSKVQSSEVQSSEVQLSENDVSEVEPTKTEPLETYKSSQDNDVVVETEAVDSETETLPTETQTIEVVAENNEYTADVTAIEVTTENDNQDIQENTNENISIEQQQVSISYSHNNTRVKQNASGIIETTAEPLAEPLNIVAANVQSKVEPDNVPATINVEQKDKFVTPQIEKQLNNVDKHGRVIHSSHQDDDIKANWIIARKSFYQRDYELSEQKYKDIIENTEDNYDAYGELGNVYFNQRKNQLAATAYYEAAAILVKIGQARRARSLVGLLRSLDKSKADELQKLIESNPS